MTTKNQYESIDVNDKKDKFNAYHPDITSTGWKNAEVIANNLYNIIGNKNADDLDETKIKNLFLILRTLSVIL